MALSLELLNAAPYVLIESQLCFNTGAYDQPTSQDIFDENTAHYPLVSIEQGSGCYFVF